MNKSLILVMLTVVFPSVLSLAGPHAAWGNIGLRTVALTDKQISNTPYSLESLSAYPHLNANGQVAFNASFSQVGSDSGIISGVWKEQTPGDDLTLVVQNGQSMPASQGTLIAGGITMYALNDRGDIILRGGPEGGSASHDALFWLADAENKIHFIAQADQIAPGTSAGPFAPGKYAMTNAYPLVNDLGEVILRTAVRREIPPHYRGDAKGIWRFSTNQPLESIVNPSIAPAGYGNPIVRDVGPFVTNSQGITTFAGTLNSQNDSLWTSRSGTLAEMFLQRGEPAPGTATLFTSFYGISVNSRGQIAFAANFEGRTSNTDRRDGIWRVSETGEPELVVKTTQTTGIPERKFRSMGGPLLAGNGDIVFMAETAQDVQGIWRANTHGEVQPIVYAGDRVPGVETEMVFENRFTAGVNVTMNQRGQLAFLGSALDPSGLRRSRKDGIWAEDIHGELQLIAIEGQSINVSSDPKKPDLKTISRIYFRGGSNNSDGYGSSFNDFGEIAFYARFTDSSEGNFVSRKVAIPEPAAVFLATSAILVFASRCRMAAFKPIAASSESV